MKMKSLAYLCLSSAILFCACKKDASSTDLKIKLTDSPGIYTEVNVDVQEINVKMAGDTLHWISLETKKGIYNLLDFQNGLDTVICEGLVPQGRLKEIRLVLGSENSIKVDEQVYPLTIPSGEESGLKIKLDKNLSASSDSVIIDFDALLSIHTEGDAFMLRPVIRVKE